jgi:predicted lipoprotein with Yx(FWY)xxD motif
VQYQPASAGAAAGSVEVYSNDPARLTGKVELKGNLGPCATQLVCSPSQVTFSGTEVGRTTAQPVTCTAAGQAVTVSGIAATGSGDLTMQAGRLPVTLQPGDTLRAEVQFAPSAAAAAVASFTFQTGGCGDAKVDVTAIGLAPNFPRCPPIAAFTPKVKWAWNGGSKMSSWSNVVMTPVVGPLTDDNGDGKVDENDIPGVVFTSCSTASCCVNCFDPKHMENADLSGEGVLRAVSGKDGKDLWTADAAALHVTAGTQIAIADVNGDGMPEIIAVQHSFRPGQVCPGMPGDSPPLCGKYISGSLLVLDRTGKLVYLSEPWTQPVNVIENDGAILVADLDQDGYPEIIFGDTVFDSTGHVKWRMSRTLGNTGHGLTTTAADVDGDGKLELIAGPTAYRADGTVLWQAAHVDDGIAMVMDVDGDGKPEVVVRPTASHIVVLDGATGSIKRDIQLPVGEPNGIASGVCPAGPSAGDFLGNGSMQLAVPAGNWFFLVRLDTGEVLWKKPIQDYVGQCGSSGAAVFSFFGDGKNDVVYHDAEHIWAWRGDGTQVYQAPRTSSTLWETPVIADIDNDGHAEILITNEGLGGTNNGLTALSDQANSWPATRRVWTQWNYHVTDANENGSVPRIEKPFWKTSRLWRGNPPLCTR